MNASPKAIIIILLAGAVGLGLFASAAVSTVRDTLWPDYGEHRDAAPIGVPAAADQDYADRLCALNAQWCGQSPTQLGRVGRDACDELDVAQPTDYLDWTHYVQTTFVVDAQRPVLEAASVATAIYCPEWHHASGWSR